MTKPNKMTFAPIEDSDQSNQSLLCPHSPQLPTEHTMKIDQSPGWSESSLGAQTILLVLSWGSSNTNLRPAFIMHLSSHGGWSANSRDWLFFLQSWNLLPHCGDNFCLERPMKKHYQDMFLKACYPQPMLDRLTSVRCTIFKSIKVSVRQFEDYGNIFTWVLAFLAYFQKWRIPLIFTYYTQQKF